MSDTFSKCIDEKDVRHNFEARKKHVRHIFKANEEKRCQTRFFRWVKKVSWHILYSSRLKKVSDTNFTRREKWSDTILNDAAKKAVRHVFECVKKGVWHNFYENKCLTLFQTLPATKGIWSFIKTWKKVKYYTRKRVRHFFS